MTDIPPLRNVRVLRAGFMIQRRIAPFEKDFWSTTASKWTTRDSGAVFSSVLNARPFYDRLSRQHPLQVSIITALRRRE